MVTLRLTTVVALLLLGCPARGVAAEWVVPPAHLPQTVRALREAAEAAAVGRDGAARARLVRLTPARRLVSGQRTWDVAWLYEGARSANTAVRSRTWERLKAWEQSLAAPPAVDPHQVAATTRAILADEAYRPLRAASWVDPWLPYLERLFDLLLAPLARRGATGPAGPALAVLAYALALGSLAVLVRRLVRPRPPRRAALPELLATPPAWQDAATWRRQAAARRAAGDLAGAFACAYRALLQRLDETGRLAWCPTRTAAEVAALAAGELQAGLTELARLASGIFYGGRPCGEADLARCEALTRQWWDA